MLALLLLNKGATCARVVTVDDTNRVGLNIYDPLGEDVLEETRMILAADVVNDKLTLDDGVIIRKSKC